MIFDHWKAREKSLANLSEIREIVNYLTISLNSERNKTLNLNDELDNIKQLLSEGILTITFTKKNGDERTMRCTRDLKLIPEDKHPTGSSTNKEKAGVVPVFDIEIGEWRSFREDSIVSYAS